MSWNMWINNEFNYSISIVLICLMTWPGSSLGSNEYQGVGAVPMSGKRNCYPPGVVGGTI